MNRFGRSILLLIVALAFSSLGAFAQAQPGPVPENIRAAVQPESPVQLSIDGIYQSAGNYKQFGYILRNVGDKEVRAINIRTDRDGEIGSFSLGLPATQADQLGFETGLKAGASKTLFYSVNGYDQKNGGINLSVDFVLFSDGTTWGPNLADQADWLGGVFDGQSRFIYEVKKLVAAGDEQGLKDVMMRDGPPTGMPIRSEDREKQKIGVGVGYNVTRLAFRSDLLGRGDLSGVPARLRDVERWVKGSPPPEDGRKQFTVQYSFNLPLKFVGLSRGGQHIAFDERFVADGDWLTGTRLKLKNDTDKTIRSISLMTFFPETMNGGNGMTSSLRYGPHPITQVENPKNPRIAPGQKFEIVVDEQTPGEMMRFLARRVDFSTISRVQIELNYIDYDDGTRWGGGQWYKQDPENPKRWVPLKP